MFMFIFMFMLLTMPSGMPASLRVAMGATVGGAASCMKAVRERRMFVALLRRVAYMLSKRPVFLGEDEALRCFRGERV